MLNFLGNPYDGDTIEPSLQQMQRIVEPIGGQKPKTVVYDRGGRGRNEIDGVKIKTPGNSKKKRNEKERKEDKALFKARAAIEPVIGHLKYDHGMARNFLSGILGDAVNALLAGAAFNLKMRLNEIKELISLLLNWFFYKSRQQTIPQN